MAQRTDIHKVLIIGSGPIVIGQACEFDYSGTQACKALRSLGYEIVLVNSNPATIMTDPEMADKTYIEPLNVDRVAAVIEKERPDALLPNLGGQSGLNLCSELYKAGILDKFNVKVIGVQVDAIERGEDRTEFKKTMDEYEKWFDEYIAFMEKYKRNPSDLQLLADYMKFVDQYEKTMNELDALNDADMSAADREYYLDAMNRINKKLLNAMD